MRIGIFLERLHDGTGTFQQALNIIESLLQSDAIRHEIIVFTQFKDTHQRLAELGIKSFLFKHDVYRLLDRWSATTVGGAILRRLRRLGFRRLGRHLDAFLDVHRIDLALFTECGEVAMRIGDHPFIISIWDFFHRDFPSFPEIYKGRQFEIRERVPHNTLNRAHAVIVDSPFAASRLSQIYHVDAARIVVLPFVPSLNVRRYAAGRGTETVESVRRKHKLPEQYVFWPSFPASEKNHLYLLEGLVYAERHHGLKLHAVFCGGGRQEDWSIVERQVQALGLTSRVHFLGRVADDEIPALYQGAVALVVPAYVGPTNLPPLEAAILGCPVIYSDLPEFREQMGESALYCNLADPGSLAEHLRSLLQDPLLHERLLTAQRQIAANLANIDYGKILSPVLDDYAYVRRRWAWPEN